MKSDPSLATTPRSWPEPGLVRSELDRLLSSDQFKNSRRCQSLLSYVVEETLADRADMLKERLVGVNVFGRDPAYDTAEDPVVRNAAIEVRKRLAQYYLESGRDATIRISLNAGKYIPEFRRIEPRAGSQESLLSLQTDGAALAPATEVDQPAHVGDSDSAQTRPKSRRTLILIATAAAALVTLVSWAVLHKNQTGNGVDANLSSPNSGSAAAKPNGTAPISPVGAAAAEVRILAGNQQPGPYIDHFGNQWSSDRYFTGGEAKPGVTNFFFPPADPVLFRNIRRGAFGYDIPLTNNQLYEMRLYFVEPQYRYGNKLAGDGENIRLFQVQANGQTLLNNFDIIEDAGFASTTVRAFKNITPAPDGKLHLRFIPQHEEPVLSGIELLPMSRHSIPPIRIHMSTSEYTDHAGARWNPDNFYIGGQLFDSGATVTDTSDPDLFNVSRIGNFSYAIPVPPGHYALTLFFTETWFRVPGQRVFDVSCNGAMLLHDLDVFQQAGYGHVYKKTFHGIEPNGQGKILVSLSPKVNYAELTALQVEAE